MSKSHGQCGTRVYRIWDKVKQRCNNHKNDAYHYYGGRGINVCDEWLEFIPFYEWALNNGYEDSLTIDRIDNDLGYNKDNCRWVSRCVQSRNTVRIRKHNTSGYRGVFSTRGKKRWRGQIVVNRKSISLGTHDTKIAAAKAYDKYVIDNNLEHTRNFS